MEERFFKIKFANANPSIKLSSALDKRKSVNDKIKGLGIGELELIRYEDLKYLNKEFLNKIEVNFDNNYVVIGLIGEEGFLVDFWSNTPNLTLEQEHTLKRIMYKKVCIDTIDIIKKIHQYIDLDLKSEEDSDVINILREASYGFCEKDYVPISDEKLIKAIKFKNYLNELYKNLKLKKEVGISLREKLYEDKKLINDYMDYRKNITYRYKVPANFELNNYGDAKIIDLNTIETGILGEISLENKLPDTYFKFYIHLNNFIIDISGEEINYKVEGNLIFLEGIDKVSELISTKIIYPL